MRCPRSIAAGLLLGAAPMAAVGAAPPPSFVPVFAENFPDAFVLSTPGGFVAFSTNDGPNVPMATSTDLINWRFVTDPSGKKADALPQLPAWARTGFTWAPEVMKIADKYVLYYTANHRKLDLQCIGSAVSDSLTGPFVDRAPAPLVCQAEKGGSIDASPFRDKDGKLYLYWKSDGNRIRQGTRLWGQQLAVDGQGIVGQAVDMGLTDNDPWEQHVIEAPTMVRTPDGLALFYSGGFFGWSGPEPQSPYAMNYAMCNGPLGPCHDASNAPLLHSVNEPGKAGCLSGPGHQSIFRGPGGTFIAFHAWAATRGCRKADDKRYLYVAPFGWYRGQPLIAPSLRK
jgi:beta-xylosidase